MVTSLITLATLVLVGSSVAVQQAEVDNALQAVVGFLADDGFASVTSQGQSEGRKKRAIFSETCGAYPAPSVSFMRCFNPGRVSVQTNSIVQSYYRQGNYGQCLNYFRALPVTNVVRVSTGYVGEITNVYGRTYAVNACENCYDGFPGISVRCTSAPYSHYVRQFVFRPQVNTVNYRTVNTYSVQQPVVGYNRIVDTGCTGTIC